MLAPARSASRSAPWCRRPAAPDRSRRRSRSRGGGRSAASAFSWVPKPSSAGCRPSEHEALDRPGVDELAARLGVAGALGVALGDVDALDADALHQPAHSSRVFGSAGRDAGVAGDVEQRLLDEPGHHAGVGAAAVHSGHAARPAAAEVQHALAERVVRALRQRDLGVIVEARPRLGDGVDVVAVEVLAEVHQVDRGGIDRQIDDHAAPRPGREQRGQHLAVVLLGQADLDELELALVEQRPVGVDRIDHHELRGDRTRCAAPAAAGCRGRSSRSRSSRSGRRSGHEQGQTVMVRYSRIAGVISAEADERNRRRAE